MLKRNYLKISKILVELMIIVVIITFQGYLVVANPLNACVPIQPPPKGHSLSYYNFFALIQESSCDFSHQVSYIKLYFENSMQ